VNYRGEYREKKTEFNRKTENFSNEIFSLVPELIIKSSLPFD